MRRISALVVSALALSALTACSSGGTSDCGIRPGDASSIVDAEGSIGSAPDVTFPTPLVSDSVEKSVVIAGDGAIVRHGQPVVVEATVLSGEDGSVLQQTEYAADGGSLVTAGDLRSPALGDALECATLGSRIAVVASAADSAPGGEATGTGSIVYVIDVLDAFPARADGATQLPVEGLPSVVTDPDGRPGVTIPNADPPTGYREALLKKGDGAEVADDDLVVAKLTAVDWQTGSVASAPASTWETGSATVLNLTGDAASIGSDLVDSVVGSAVGSQILAVTPSTGAGGALIYVVDILGVVG